MTCNKNAHKKNNEHLSISLSEDRNLTIFQSLLIHIINYAYILCESYRIQIAILMQAPIGTICFIPHLKSRMRLPGIGETESMRLAPQNARCFSILPMHYIR
jgi:hypothetical protein